MPESGFVFEGGEAIDVGQHGDTDLVYHQGDPVPNTGQSSLVFEQGVGLGGGVIIDDFERGDLSPYSGDTGRFAVVTSGALEGTYSGAIGSMNTDDGSVRIYSLEGDGLPNYFELGDTLRMNFVYDSEDQDFEINWAHDSTDPYGNHYWAELDPENNQQFRLGGRDSGSNFGTYAGTDWDGSPYVGQELIWELDWADDGTVTSTLLDLSENTIVSISGKDGRYDGNVSIGYDVNPQGLGSGLNEGDIRWDSVRKVV